MWQITPIYLDFFRQNIDERMMILMGSRRSGKTTNTFLYMYAISLLSKGQKFTTLTYQYPQLAKTMSDFEKTIGAKLKRTKEGFSYRDNNKNLWLFDHCDDTSKALGNDCDLLFINESVNVPEEIADNYMLGCTSKVILNFNPIHHSWHEKYINNNNLLKTTFKDNPYLTESQKQAFESMRLRAESPLATPLDKYNYEVYYLGNFSTVSGKIFTNVQPITYEDYLNIPTDEFLGLDFGFKDGGDATSLVGVKIYNKTIYTHCYIYDNSLERLSDLAAALDAAGVKEKDIFADYGGLGKSRMEDLIYYYNFNMCNALKPKVIDNIGRILSFDGGIKITENSDAMLKEFSCYEMINGKLKEDKNHSIDAFRYAFNAATYYAV